MAKKTYKIRKYKYTALIPRTIKAVNNIKNHTVKRTKIFVKSMKTRVKNMSKVLDRGISKSIRTLTK
jgi:hypothetical protein